MPKKDIEIKTADGTARAGLFGAGAKAAVILYMDAFGPRPALDGMAERLASEGYAVLVPDLFYRNTPYGPFDARTAFAEEESRNALMAIIGATTQDMTIRDTGAFLEALAAEGVTGPIGAVGYCLGGARALNAAASYPERIKAAASFMAATLPGTHPTARIATLPRSRVASMSAWPASTAAFRRSNRRGSPKRCASPKSTTSSKTMSAWRMAGAFPTMAFSTRRAPNATGSG